MIHHSSSKPSTSSVTKHKRLDMQPKITITPQRKHRKLLKDGSGHEVWPEEVEKVFVQGLRDYWESPWATYSRGRSRWRNQFLVDYLKKAGIERSKKQVASHIQVLRNMWKGEPEFNLVAGGEELFLETGLLAPVKVEEQYDPNNLIFLPGDEDESGSPVSPSEPFPAFADEHRYGNPPSPLQPLSPVFETTASLANFTADSISPIMGVPLSLSPTGTGSPLPDYRSNLQVDSRHTSPNFNDFPQSYSHLSFSNPTKSPALSGSLGDLKRPALTETLSAPSSPYRSLLNRITHLCLWTEGMPPISLAMDTLAVRSSGAQSSPMSVQFNLHLPSIDDFRSPPTLHGFLGSVSMTNSWLSFTKCITKVYANNDCISVEEESLQYVPPSDPSTDSSITALLPESSLSRSRWLQADVQTMITQEIIVDGVSLALFAYNLDRTNDGLPPSAEVTGFQKLVTPKAAPAMSGSIYPHLPNNYAPIRPSPMAPSYHRVDDTSLACALIPNKPIVSRSSSLLP